jgi:hypothetical protein
MVDDHPTVRIELTWNSTRKHWRIWARQVDSLGKPRALTMHETADTTIEIDRGALRGLVTAIRDELERALF